MSQFSDRVLIRSANNPAMVACWLAATKAGAVVVNTMPMLRAGELSKIVDKAEVSLALCDSRLMEDMEACAADSRFLKRVVAFDGKNRIVKFETTDGGSSAEDRATRACRGEAERRGYKRVSGCLMQPYRSSEI